MKRVGAIDYLLADGSIVTVKIPFCSTLIFITLNDSAFSFGTWKFVHIIGFKGTQIVVTGKYLQ